MERGQSKGALCDRRHAREMPILILGRRIPERLEAADSPAAQILEPLRTRWLLLKILAIDLDRAGSAGARGFAASHCRISRDYILSDGNLPHDFSGCHVAQDAAAATPAEFWTQS